MGFGIIRRDSRTTRDNPLRITRRLLWVVLSNHNQDSNIGQLENSGNHLQTIYMYATSCEQVGLVFDLAITCFTHCRKNFKKFVFLASPKTWVVTATTSTVIPRGKLVARNSFGSNGLTVCHLSTSHTVGSKINPNKKI